MAEGRFVVSNSSPLIALDRIGQLDLMRALFAEVVVPPAVLHEVFAGSDSPAWLRVVAPAVMLDDTASPTLGRGEREAIALAVAAGARRIILDDLPARRLAASLGLPVIGTAGLVLAAKNAVGKTRTRLVSEERVAGAQDRGTPTLPDRRRRPHHRAARPGRPRAARARAAQAVSDVQEPLGTLLRLGVLSFGADGWLGMAGTRLSLTILVYTFAVLAFPARRTLVGVGHELDAMLAEGQGGFSDIMKSPIARKR